MRGYKNTNLKIVKYFAIVVLIISYANSIYGQPGEERKQKIEAQKATYITNQINLTPEEAQKFWPFYNEYQLKKEELQKAKRLSMQEYRIGSINMEESEMEKIIDGYIDIQVKEAELLKEYHEKYKTVLPIEKVIKLYQAENQFKQFLLRQIKGQGYGDNPDPRSPRTPRTPRTSR